MTDILFIANVGFEILSTSFKNKGFDLVMTIGVDEGCKVFCVGLRVEEGAEGGCCTKVRRVVVVVVVGYIDCSCL